MSHVQVLLAAQPRTSGRLLLEYFRTGSRFLEVYVQFVANLSCRKAKGYHWLQSDLSLFNLMQLND